MAGSEEDNIRSLQDPMAGSEEDRIRSLLEGYIRHEDLRDIVQKLLENRLGVDGLLLMSDSEIDDLILECFPVGSSTRAKLGFKTAIRLERKRLHVTRVYAEGEPSKKAVLSTQELNSARKSYFGKLLEPPQELPTRADQIAEFLSERPVMLPVLTDSTLRSIGETDLVEIDKSEVVERLAVAVECRLSEASGLSPPGNESRISAVLCRLTGEFLEILNKEAPGMNALRGLTFSVDASNPRGSTTSSQFLKPLSRPDFLLYVERCLILRWENKFNSNDAHLAMKENVDKLTTWSPLFYGKLPYVIGGWCAGQQFQWLQLHPGVKIECEPISRTYDLRLPRDVAWFLHSTVRMHCLLQRLQGMLGDRPVLYLYGEVERPDGKVVFHPDCVEKLIPTLDTAALKNLRDIYDKVANCEYLIHSRSIKSTRQNTKLILTPVGDPKSQPESLVDLQRAVHDILKGLMHLHNADIVHRDLRWENVVKVNVRSEWKWVVIDLERAGPADEKWDSGLLTEWDAQTLVGNCYTKRSDVYQLGKMINRWLLAHCEETEEWEGMLKLAQKMQRKRTATSTILQPLCGTGCERCLKFR